MTQTPNGNFSREELIAARDQLARKIEVLENSLRQEDRDLDRIARLRAGLSEIESYIPQNEGSGSSGSTVGSARLPMP